MKCDLKTMLRVGGILAIILAGGYFIFPQFRPVIIGLAPFALFTLCPISMFFAMNAMNKNKDHPDNCTSCGHQHEKQSQKT